MLRAAARPLLRQPVIPVAVILFVVGRLCFAVG